MTSTAAPTGPARPSRVEVDLAWALDRWTGVPLSASPDDVLAERLERHQRQRAIDAAEEAELILALAEQRSAAFDPPADRAGARRPGWSRERAWAEISEFFPAELSMVLNLGRGTAAHRLERALTWRDKLPATFALLHAGAIDERRANALFEALRTASVEVAGRVEDRLLPQANDLSVTWLRDRAAELMVELDPVAAEEARATAAEAADVTVFPSPVPGRSTLAVDLPTDEAVIEFSFIDALARQAKNDGDERPIGVIRTEVYRAWFHRLLAAGGGPVVNAHITVTADLTALEGRDTAPGEVNGLVITAANVRELLARVGALGLVAPEGGSLSFAITGPDGELLATVTPTELERVAKRGCPDHPDSACGCAVLGAPPATDAYQPTARQRAFVTTRDRRCRFPNCGQRVGWADLDHVVPHACGGRTDCANLCCLCRSHHRLKTFARGWQFRLDSDGTLHATTPSGVTRTTRPPGMHVRALDPPIAEPGEPEPPPAPQAGPVDDPPPF